MNWCVMVWRGVGCGYTSAMEGTRIGMTEDRRVAQLIRADIDKGRWAVGEKLPSYPALAREHQVSPTTLGHALDILKKERRVIAVRGKGVFVNEPGTEPAPPQLAEPASISSTDTAADMLNKGAEKRMTEAIAALTATVSALNDQLSAVDDRLDAIEARLASLDQSYDQSQ